MGKRVEGRGMVKRREGCDQGRGGGYLRLTLLSLSLFCFQTPECVLLMVLARFGLEVLCWLD
jgi:hypothetical protein